MLGRSSSQLRILQWNCNGVRPKLDQLRAFLDKEKIDCAFIQETHLNRHHGLSLGEGYTVRRLDRPSHKGGVMSVFNTRLHRVYRMRIQPPAGVEGQSWILYTPNNQFTTGTTTGGAPTRASASMLSSPT